MWLCVTCDVIIYFWGSKNAEEDIVALVVVHQDDPRMIYWLTLTTGGMTVRVKRRICISSVLSVLAVAYFGHTSFNPGLMVDVSTKLLSSPSKLDDDGGGIIPEASKCTESELNTIRYQLPPDDCIKNRGTPFNQRCSMTYATRCECIIHFCLWYVCPISFWF